MAHWMRLHVMQVSAVLLSTTIEFQMKGYPCFKSTFLCSLLFINELLTYDYLLFVVVFLFVFLNLFL